LPDEFSVSAIVRTKDKAESLPATLRSLRDQTISMEIVVVDSGSTDGTLDIARSQADKVVELPADEFSFGRALNLGATNATGDVHLALSAHLVLPNRDWLARSLEHYANEPDVVATNGLNGETALPDGSPITGPYVQTASDIPLDPYWGYSNTASTWRAETWRAFPFREDLDSCEDKEWSWRVLRSGRKIAYDPALSVDSSHRRNEGSKRLFKRIYREATVLHQIGGVEPWSVGDVAKIWVTRFDHPSRFPRAVRLASPKRNVELLAQFFGGRHGARLR
jgi:rhamnosyltransferase